MPDSNIKKSLRIAALIARQLNYTLTSAEENELSDWLLERESNQQLLKKITDLQSFERYRDEIESYDSNDALLQVKVRILTEEEVRPKQKRLWLPISIAASVIVFFSAYMVWNYNQPVKWITVTTAYGKITQVHLPDSSLVSLNAGTTITYPEKFKGNTRPIRLISGDACFTVVHIAHKPFIIKSNNMEVTVLGTSFEVSAFEKEKEMRVTVKTGKVGIMQPNINKKVTFLLPGDGAVINRATNALHKIQVDTADIGAWRNGRLIFEDQLFAEVVASLERTYNVEIDIENPALLNERITMRLNNQPLNNVLSALSYSKHFNYKIINEQLIIVK